MARVNDKRVGRDNDSMFEKRMRGEGEIAELKSKRFYVACRKFGLDSGFRVRLDTTQFNRPGGSQLFLFL